MKKGVVGKGIRMGRLPGGPYCRYFDLTIVAQAI